MFRNAVRMSVVAWLAATAGRAPIAFAGSETHSFTVSGAFLREVARQGVLVDLPVRFTASGGVHPVQNDCEMHWAAQSRIPLGDPGGLVTEPPNVCRTWPPAPAGRDAVRDAGGDAGGDAGRVGRRRLTWRQFAERSLIGRECVVRGFPRLASEHAGGTGSPATPPHIVEIHPLLSVRGSGVALDFARDLRAVPGMVHKRPDVTEPTLRRRRLWVRRAGDNYQLRDNGEGADWNFAIVEVDCAAARVRPVRGGHALAARVRVRDAGPVMPLTLYTLDGTAADARAAAWTPNAPGVWRVLGLLTYDPLAIVTTLRDGRGVWKPVAAWTEVPRPLALVVWGETAD